MLIDELLPRCDFNDVHSVAIDASAEVVYAALFTTDLGSSIIVRGLMGLRTLPAWLQSGPRPERPGPLALGEIGRAGFTLIAERPPHEVVLGIQGAFWKLRPDCDSMDADAFKSPVPEGVARALWNFVVEPIGASSCRLVTETRILCGDDASRRRFGRYWTLIKPGSAIIRIAILSSIGEEANRKSANLR